ncbi:MAG TPA: hypothetical protein VHY84_23460 [Bryobacteraceae bacterium]|jgi:hypothetical protein|nr:hypothetical protein [Bryobacteraceae bacterium]
MTDNQIRDLFREMREEPVPPDSLALIRMKLEDRIRSRARWKVAARVTAAAMVMLIALLLPHGAVTHKAAATKALAMGQPAKPSVDVPETAPLVAVRPAIQKTRRRPRASSAPVEIRIETADPDVVILLVSQ